MQAEAECQVQYGSEVHGRIKVKVKYSCQHLAMISTSYDPGLQ